MKKIAKIIFGDKGARIWFIVSSVLTVVLLVITILATTVLYELLSSVIGGSKRIVDGSSEQAALYKSDYDSKQEAYEAANLLNEKINEEGIVLLKNEGALPLAKNERVHVFGKNSVNLVYGGSGSGAGSSDGRKTIYDSLEAADIGYNQSLKAFYEDDTESGDPRPSNPPIENSGVFLNTGETPVSRYGNLWTECENSNIATALVVFSRIGGEGFDLPRTMVNKNGDGAVAGANKDDHYLQLDQNEREMLAKVCSLKNIEHVIVIINSSTSMELGFLNDEGHYAYNGKIDGALWIGGPGNSGIMALGRVLNGTVNPSGRLVDTYVRDFTRDPSYVNFGDNSLNERVGKYTISGDQYMESVSKSYPYYFVDYEEGVYVGYRYWETRGYTEGKQTYTDSSVLGTTTSEWNSWYDAHVVFPFGYGLSYSEFEWELLNGDELNNKVLDKNKFTVKLKVTNIGNHAGKDVVEIYATAPYSQGGIEKPHKVLCGFAKTPTLYPASEADEGKPNFCELEITVDPYDIASYDYNDANKNMFRGYELEKGAYVFAISRNAHESEIDIDMTVDDNVLYAKDPVTGYDVVNRFDDSAIQLSDVTIKGSIRKGLSRSDWEGTWPTSRRERVDRVVDSAFITELEETDSRNPNVGNYKMPEQAKRAKTADIMLRSMHAVEYNDGQWEKFMNQITAADMLNLVSKGNFKSPAVLNVGKPETLESDGPVGFVNFMDKEGRYYDTCSYASECVMAATWNTELLKEVGRAIGNEGIWGNAKGDGAPYSGLYAPGVNIHRSPFSGRNFEYFSEDGYLAGMLAASEISGAKEKGVYMYIKHFAVNDQETHRDSNGLITWVTEQAMRELYFKPFEKAVKVGGTTAVMSSFNRIGTVWAGGDYRLLTEVLRNEWGFKGTVISDFNLSVYMNAEQMHYAGGDLNLTTMSANYWNADLNKPADVYVLRQCSKNIMYTVANSCAVNDAVIGYSLPTWTILLIVLDCAVAVGLGVWGFFTVRKSVKKNGKEEKSSNEITD